ncbi:MAG: serine protease Do [Myxococcota bacterium]|jgi:serine protease Do
MARHRTRSTWRIKASLLVVAFITATAGAGAWAVDLFDTPEPSPTDTQEPLWEEVEAPAFITPIGVPNSFADLAEQVSPAVVNIQVSSDRTQQFGMDERFHGFPFGPPGNGGRRPAWGAGTGFVISANGYIATNAHVVDGADEINVSFLDGKSLPAKVIGLDIKTDLALIKVESDVPLPAIPLGDSDAVRPGEWVVAIGNAMNLEHTVTAGIVSAKHRYLARGNYDDFIQTDAAINPGNSGGPLINLAGEVIGINTAINPEANTIGFAVPIKIAKQILPQLKSHGRVSRGWLGVEIHELTAELKEETGATEGALIQRVLPETPAMKAGLLHGDIIITFNGDRVPSHRQLPNIVANTPIDEPVPVEVIRDGKQISIDVTLAVMDEPSLASNDRRHGLERKPERASFDHFGVDTQKLTADLAEQLGFEQAAGVIVTRVVAGGPAEKAGLLRGDVILEVEGAAIESPSELDTTLDGIGDGAVLLVRRAETTLFIPIQRSS